MFGTSVTKVYSLLSSNLIFCCLPPLIVYKIFASLSNTVSLCPLTFFGVCGGSGVPPSIISRNLTSALSQNGTERASPSCSIVKCGTA